MDKDWEYLSLSKRFESFAEKAADPKLAAAYRSLANHYRALDNWRQMVKHRYESFDTPPDDETAPEAAIQPEAATQAAKSRKTT
jgi:hypothetical protein